ncbi:MAG: adenylate/guanylate cyclase domain-containing protein [Pseudomonadota bacterium]
MLKKYASRIISGLLITSLFIAWERKAIEIPLFDRLELMAYDARLTATIPEHDVDPRVVIIDIDERSLAAEGHWPWNRIKLAKMVENLFDVYYVDTLGFDVVFAERDSAEEMELLESLAEETGDTAFLNRFQDYKPYLNPDEVFARAMQDRQVIMGYYFDKSIVRNTEVGAIGDPLFEKGTPYYDMLSLQQTSQTQEDGTEVMVDVDVSSFTGNVPELQASAYGAGFYSIPSQDKDGILRRIQLLEKYDGAIYESLSLALAKTYLVSDVDLITGTDQDGESVVEGLTIGIEDVPIDTDGATYIPYKGRAYSFRYVSATDVINQTVENPDDLAGIIAILGTTAAGLVDLRNTPLQQNRYPGVEVHAVTLTGLLGDSFRSRPYYAAAAEFLMILMLGITLTLLLPTLGSITQTFAWLGSSALVIAGNLYLWQYQNTILTLAPLLLLATALYMLNMAYGYFFESRNKAKISGLFGQYIPPELVDEMSKDPHSYDLEAKKEELTVLFSDVRGFTAISEGLDPKSLSDLMNELLSPMTRIVHDNKGTIDKYMGDAMMAFWGAPIANDNHANTAVASGFEMLAEIDVLNEAFAKKNWPEVKIGIGLNTGEMNVGNMGSEFRMAYTVLGDAVNLGSRVEGLTKQYGVYYIVTEFTASIATDFEYRVLDSVRVKGKDQPVTILEPIALKTEITAQQREELDAYDEALQLYLGAEFSKASTKFESLNADFGDRFLYNLYIDRCEHFINEPPGADWDGVFTFTTK